MWGGRGRTGWPGEGVPGEGGGVRGREWGGVEGWGVLRNMKVKSVRWRSVFHLYLPSGEQPARRSLEGSCLDTGSDSTLPGHRVRQYIHLYTAIIFLIMTCY